MRVTRPLRALLAACLLAVAVQATGVDPAAAVATRIVGSVAGCTTAKGAIVVVDFSHWSGPGVRGCATTLTTGRALLTSAGFSITGTKRFPAFVCRLGHKLFNAGAPHPASGQDPCVVPPPSTRYWSYWTAARGATTWTYSPRGVDGDVPTNGAVRGWAYGAGARPTVTPAQVRAGLPAAKAAGDLAPRASLRTLAAGTTPDVASGADFLVDQLTDGNHYEQFGLADIGLTIDGALALAASGGHDQVLGDLVDYVAAHQNDFTLLSGPYRAYASGGAVGKVALLAEVTGRDPHSFGGVDLVSSAAGLVCPKADAGTQCAAKGNYAFTSSVFGQSIAIIAALRAGDTAGSAAPIAFLESLQSSGGGFASLIPSNGSASETDSTAIAAMALALVPGAKARLAVGKALAWLANEQAGDGGFPGAAGNSVNSAALAVQALQLDGETYADRIGAAQRFLAAAQNADGGFDLSSDIDGSDLRASAQAVGGAVGLPFGSVLDDLAAKRAAAAGANYLVRQLVDGNHLVTSFGGVDYDDQGLTADAAFALLATGGHDSTVAAIVAYLEDQVDAYADTSGAFGGPYSGSLAKLALVAESTGADPHAFGGADLLRLLRSHVCTAATVDGACTAAGDFVSAFSGVSQALGVLALQASPVAADHLTATSPPVLRLHQLQCADGGFSSTLIAPGGACTSEVDTTGYAVQALAAVPDTDPWLGKAQLYLQQQQRESGLYPGAAGDNSNSTAFGAQALQTLVRALVAATVDPPGPKPVTPIVALQAALRGLVGLSVDGGGFGLTDDASADPRASTQAVAAAAQRSLLALSGAPIRSTPRLAAVAPGTPSSTLPPSQPPTSTSYAYAYAYAEYQRCIVDGGAAGCFGYLGPRPSGRHRGHDRWPARDRVAAARRGRRCDVRRPPGRHRTTSITALTRSCARCSRCRSAPLPRRC